MAQGDIINYNNIVSTLGNSWTASGQTDNGALIYISSPSFVVQSYVHSGALFAGITAYFHTYKWNGNSFVEVDNRKMETNNGAAEKNFKFYHNRAAEGTSSYDDPHCHWWKFWIEHKSHTGAVDYRNRVWIGGMGMLTEAEYNTLFKGQFIRAVPIVITTGNDYSDTGFIQLVNPDNYRGTPISIASDTYKMIGAY